jgi:phosphatidylglycerophosphate synthase
MVTIEEIKERGQLSAKEHIEEERGNYPYVGYVLRRISPYFTKFFVEHNISANQVSALSVLLGIAANVTFIFGDYYFMFLGCIIYNFWAIFDLVDGEIARVTDAKTAGGKYLETINEPITECGFMLCLGIGLSKMLNDQAFMFWGVFFALCYALLSDFARTRDMLMAQRFQIQEKNANIKEKLIKKIYKKARVVFLTGNAYLILIGIIIIELLSQFSFQFLGQNLNILSLYFLVYGLIWVVRMTISSANNYTQLHKKDIKNVKTQPSD